MSLDRDRLLALDDEALLHLCKCETFRGSGPGGQHRNTTDSAVRLTLLAHPEIGGYACDERSQHRNRHLALGRLRLAIALSLRQPARAWEGEWKIAAGNPRYPLFAACLADALEAAAWQVGEAARLLGTSTGKLVRLLGDEPQLWSLLQRERQKRGLKPLRHD